MQGLEARFKKIEEARLKQNQALKHEPAAAKPVKLNRPKASAKSPVAAKAAEKSYSKKIIKLAPKNPKKSITERLGKMVAERLGKTVVERLGKPLPKGTIFVGDHVLGPRKVTASTGVGKKRKS